MKVMTAVVHNTSVAVKNWMNSSLFAGIFNHIIAPLFMDVNMCTWFIISL